MWRCNNGYELTEDLKPPDRCHCIDKDEFKTCKECDSYNKEYDLIERAIEPARCRIYRVKQNKGSTLTHQIRVKNQIELMKVTIKALEYYRDNY